MIDNIAQNVYQTTLGDSIVNYISNPISNTLLGDTILQYITNNITNTVLGDSIIGLVHENELDGVVGNEVTDATIGGGLVRSGTGTAASPYTLGVANSGVTASHLANNAVTSAKIQNGTIQAEDLNSMGAIEGDVLTYSSSAWIPMRTIHGTYLCPLQVPMRCFLHLQALWEMESIPVILYLRSPQAILRLM